MDKLFYTRKNLKVLTNIVRDKFEKDAGLRIGDKFDGEVLNAIKYVRKTSSTITGNKTKEEYLIEMNKQVLSICIPRISGAIESVQSRSRDETPSDGYSVSRPTKTENPVDSNLDAMLDRITRERAPNTNQVLPVNFEDKVDDNMASPDDLFKKAMQERPDLVFNPPKQPAARVDDVYAPAPVMQPSDPSVIVEPPPRVDVNTILGSEIPDPKKLYESQKLAESQQLADTMQDNYISDYPVIRRRDHKYSKKVNYVVVDSRDRDFELFPNPNKFQVKFAPTGDSISIPEQFCADDGTVVYELPRKFKGDDKGANIPDVFNNIYSVEVIEAIVPGIDRFIIGTCPVGSRESPTAVGINILNEQYVLLNVKELEGYDTPYVGTSDAITKSLAKLRFAGSFGVTSQFISFTTVDGEKKYYNPSALGKIDKMTLNLTRHNGRTVNFGQDRIKVFSIGIGDIAPAGVFSCESQTAVEDGEVQLHMTRITIVKTGDAGSEDYEDVVCGHCLDNGNLLYFYDTVSCEDTVFFTENVKLDTTNFPCVRANIVKGQYVVGINFNKFLRKGDYLRINCGLHKILEMSNDGMTLVLEDKVIPFDIEKLGFVKKNDKGVHTVQRQDFMALNDISGYNAVKIIDECTFDINFPYERLSQDFLENYHSGDVFYINHKLQVSYTFRIETLEQNPHPLQSEIVGFTH